MTDRIVINNGVKIHYKIKKGNQTPLIFLHGATSSSSAWERMIPLFSKDKNTLVTVDLRGCGYSDRPLKTHEYSLESHASDVAKILEEEGLEHVIIIGHCFGGMISVTLAKQYPRRIDKLVLINSGIAMPWRLKNRIIGLLVILIARIVSKFPMNGRKGRVDYSKYRHIPDIDIFRFYSDFSTSGLAVVARQFLAYLEWDSKRYYFRLDKKILLIAGRDDSIFTMKDTQNLTAIIPQSRNEFIGGNHILILNSPREIYHLISDFINQT